VQSPRCGAAPENGFAVFSRREAPLPRVARRSRPAALPDANRSRIHPRARRQMFGISMCAKQREVCEKFRKLKMRKKTGLCLGFFSLNETP
jgi:hypothetical protein